MKPPIYVATTQDIISISMLGLKLGHTPQLPLSLELLPHLGLGTLKLLRLNAGAQVYHMMQAVCNISQEQQEG